jgi:hypothetical protein
MEQLMSITRMCHALQSFPLSIVQGDNIDKLKIKIMEFIKQFLELQHIIYLNCVEYFLKNTLCVCYTLLPFSIKTWQYIYNFIFQNV